MRMNQANWLTIIALSVRLTTAGGQHCLAQDDVPAAFVHAWEGMVTQTATFPLRYEITGGAIGGRIGEWELPTFACGGPVSLRGVPGETELEVTEALALNASGKCVSSPSNTVRLVLLDEDTLSYDYSDADGVRVTGALLRNQAELTYAVAPCNGCIDVDASLSMAHAGTALVDYQWDFGDGAQGSGIRASHCYGRAGRYRVRLTVSNDALRVDSREQTVTVHCCPGDVAPWTSAGVGDPDLRGAAHAVPGGDGPCLEVCAGGRAIAGSADELQLVYQPLASDGALLVRLSSLDGGGPVARAGLMLRESLDHGSRHAALVVGGALRPVFLTREQAGGGTLTRTAAHALALPDVWLRLERRGEEIVSSHSNDGEAWTELARTTFPGLSSTLLAGLAASAGDTRAVPFTALHATFCDVALGPAVAPLPRFLRGDCNGDGEVGGSVSDAIALLGFSFLGAAEPPCLVACDANGDRVLDLSDAVYVLAYNFLGGPSPPAPFPGCGEDPTIDASECEKPGPCR